MTTIPFLRNPKHTQQSGVIYSADGKTLIHCPKNYSREFEIPEGVEIIGIEAFAGCRQLTAIKIPASTCKIAFMAFSKCPGLKSIKIFNQTNVIRADEDAFSDIDKNICLLMVPEQLVFVYKKTPGWSEFKNIVSLEKSNSNNTYSIHSLKQVI